MSNDVFYNIIEKDISNGLKNEAVDITGEGNYFILQYAPSKIELKVRLNSNLNPQIRLKQNSGFEALNVKKIFLECEPVANEKITIIHSKSSEEFRYIPPTYGKLDIGTVDSIKLVENINVLHTLKNIEAELSAGGNKYDKSFVDLIQEGNTHLITFPTQVQFSETSEPLNIYNLILEAENELLQPQTPLKEIDYTLFDYVIIGAEVSLNIENYELPDNTVYDYQKYATYILSMDTVPCNTISFIDDNPNTSNRIMRKTFTSKEYKLFNDLGVPLHMYCNNMHSPNEGYGNIYPYVSLFKKSIDIQKDIYLGNYELDFENNTIVNIYEVDTTPPNGADFLTYAGVQISCVVNDKDYTLIAKKYGRNFDYTLYLSYGGLSEQYEVWFEYNFNEQRLTIGVYKLNQDISLENVSIQNLNIHITGYA